MIGVVVCCCLCVVCWCYCCLLLVRVGFIAGLRYSLLSSAVVPCVLFVAAVYQRLLFAVEC